MANARPFRALRKLSDEERAQALGRIEGGIHPQDVANQFNVHRSTIIRLRDRHRATGTVSDRHRSGRPKVTTQHEDRYIAVTRRHFVDGPSLERMLRHVESRCRLSGKEFDFRGSVPETLLKSLSFPADGMDSNGHESSSLMNPGFVCDRWMDASEYGVATGRDT